MDPDSGQGTVTVGKASEAAATNSPPDLNPQLPSNLSLVSSIFTNVMNTVKAIYGLNMTRRRK